VEVRMKQRKDVGFHILRGGIPWLIDRKRTR
jgi:hypothetical protein